jgi:hypothetical protein
MFVVQGSKLLGSAADDPVMFPDVASVRKLYKLEIEMTNKKTSVMYF